MRRCGWTGTDPLYVAYHEVQDAFGSFAAYPWGFVGGRPIRRARRSS